EHELVFPTKRGEPIDDARVDWALKEAQVRAGVVDAQGKGKYSLHKLRHFYASWCINRKVDGGLELSPYVVQQRLGHASIRITLDRYGHLFPRGDDTAELAAADEAFFGVPAPAPATVTVLKPPSQAAPVEELLPAVTPTPVIVSKPISETMPVDAPQPQ